MVPEWSKSLTTISFKLGRKCYASALNVVKLLMFVLLHQYVISSMFNKHNCSIKAFFLGTDEVYLVAQQTIMPFTAQHNFKNHSYIAQSTLLCSEETNIFNPCHLLKALL